MNAIKLLLLALTCAAGFAVDTLLGVRAALSFLPICLCLFQPVPAPRPMWIDLASSGVLYANRA